MEWRNGCILQPDTYCTVNMCATRLTVLHSFTVNLRANGDQTGVAVLTRCLELKSLDPACTPNILSRAPCTVIFVGLRLRLGLIKLEEAVIARGFCLGTSTTARVGTRQVK